MKFINKAHSKSSLPNFANNPSYKTRLSAKINIPLFSLFFAMLFFQSLFFYYAVDKIRENSDSMAMQVSSNVAKTLESDLLNLEHTAELLQERNEVKNLLKSDNFENTNSEEFNIVSNLLNIAFMSNNIVENIVLYNAQGDYTNLRGELSGDIANEIDFISSKQDNSHVYIISQKASYICYVSSISENNNIIGSVAFLINTEKLNTLFDDYNEHNNLIIGLIAGDTVLTCNENEYNNSSFDTIITLQNTYILQTIGHTPFSVFVASDGSEISTIVQFFTALALVIFLVIFLLQYFIYRFLRKSFFTPMIQIMENSKLVGYGSNTLNLTGHEDFDELVERINSMIVRLNEQKDDLYSMQYKMQNSEIEQQKALILSLKKQINSHFTVNTINNIKRLTEIGKAKQAGEICDGLSDLLRYANNADEYINGFEEMHILEHYIDIMTIRYPGAFTVNFEVDDELDDYYLPRMLMQPIVENAITHGLLGVSEGKLKISGKIKSESIEFVISDNGVGIKKEQLKNLNHKLENIENEKISEGLSGIALLNIQKRIFYLFGKDFGMKIYSTKSKGTNIVLTLPIIKQGF